MDLYTASGLGLVDFVKAEIKRHPENILKPNKKGWTAIMYACFYSQWKIVSLLAKLNPASLYSINDRGQTPLMLAAQTGDLNLVKILVKPDILHYKDDRGWTALFYAVYNGHEDIIHYLIECGANVNDRDYESRTILMTAIESEQENVIELLIVYGAHDLQIDYTTIESNVLHQKHFQLMLLLSITSVTDLSSFLHIIGLNNYSNFFKEQNISFDEFLKLNEGDLKVIGVNKLGPRRKMALAAQKYNYLKELSKQLRNSSYY